MMSHEGQRRTISVKRLLRLRFNHLRPARSGFVTRRVTATLGAVVSELHFFDPNDEVSILERKFPHWSQPGVVCFITIRTHDSFAKETLQRFHADRRHWLRRHGINPDLKDWREKLKEIGREPQKEFYKTFSIRWHDTLDRGEGLCVLEDPRASEIVAQSFLKFDGDRYEVTDFVVMPNHAHILVAFRDEDMMLAQCESWKRYTGREINKLRGASGRFWQQDGFDHLVRSLEQFEHFQRYIANNPIKAHLKPDTYRHYSK
jgi:putative transposase